MSFKISLLIKMSFRSYIMYLQLATYVLIIILMKTFSFCVYFLFAPISHDTYLGKQASWSHLTSTYEMSFLFSQNGTADAASMTADDIYAAGLCHGLELSAGESHNGAGKSQVWALQC